MTAALTTVLGGIGLFLLGMWLLTDGLKLAAGGMLHALLERSTGTPRRALATGFLVTATVQSSSAVIVALIGFVNAGLMNLAQAAWVVFGANVGTTMTGWLVAIVGIKVDMAAIALPLIGLGMLARLAGRGRWRLEGWGKAATGFGIFFLGVGLLQQGFGTLDDRLAGLAAAIPAGWLVPAFVVLGTLLTVVTQSSSAAVAILLTAGASTGLPVAALAGAMVGTNIGTTSTAVFAAIDATPPARRVAAVHIAFNLVAATAALALLPVLLWISEGLRDLAGQPDDLPLALAIFHTLFNVLGVLLIWRLASWLLAQVGRRFGGGAPRPDQPSHLDANLAAVPEVAMTGLIRELTDMTHAFPGLLRSRLAATADGMAASDDLLARANAVRGFVERLDRQAMPPAVLAQLPDAIRATQHLARLANRLGQLAGSGDMHQDVAAFGMVVADGMANGALRLEPVLEAYETTKAGLLTAAADGRLTLPLLDAHLERAHRMRDIAEIMVKLERRLARLRSAAQGPAESGGAAASA